MGMAGEAEGLGDRLTIDEAAEYLGVSKPTIFRWMKDGALSYFKIGGKTRFTREGLEAVVEKTTGKAEARSARSRCASCGHSTLVDGTVQGTGRLYFKPEKAKFWVWAQSMVPLRARVCAVCGYLQLHADTSKLEVLTGGSPAPETEEAAEGEEEKRELKGPSCV